jgi:hypothetical protein
VAGFLALLILLSPGARGVAAVILTASIIAIVVQRIISQARLYPHSQPIRRPSQPLRYVPPPPPPFGLDPTRGHELKRSCGCLLLFFAAQILFVGCMISLAAVQVP